MFIAIQFPNVDPRPFLPEGSAQLTRPNWGDPEPSGEFVRNFGSVMPRRRGGLADWPGEGKYCSADNAIRFNGPLPKISIPDAPGQSFRAICAFRRLLSDGRFALEGGYSVSHRLELGFAVRRGKRQAGLNQGQFDHVLQCMRGITVRPVASGFPARNFPIEQSALCLSNLLSHATTSHSKNGQGPQSMLAAARPLALVEYRIPYESLAPPKHAEKASLDDPTVHLAYTRAELSPLGMATWYLAYHCDPQFMTNRDTTRRLRLHLFRIHAERESMKQVLRWIACGRIKAEICGNPADRLQRYLGEATRLLLRKQSFGLPQSELLARAANAYDLVSEGEAATLLQQLKSIRPRIRASVSELLGSAGQNVCLVAVHAQQKEITVINQNITLGPGVIINGPFTPVAAHQISDSFKNIAASNAPADIKASLEKLHTAVADMMKQLPSSQQESVCTDLATLTREATATNPRKEWWELSAKGLLEAAQALGAIAAPVINAVKAVVALLA